MSIWCRCKVFFEVCSVYCHGKSSITYLRGSCVHQRLILSMVNRTVNSFAVVWTPLHSFAGHLRTNLCELVLDVLLGSVIHNILLSKMEFYGIIGKANNLIKSYLQNSTNKKRFNKLLFWLGTDNWQDPTGINTGSPFLFVIHKRFTKYNIGSIYTNFICRRH